jgi:DNA polymerase-3 subunit epsilon
MKGLALAGLFRKTIRRAAQRPCAAHEGGVVSPSNCQRFKGGPIRTYAETETETETGTQTETGAVAQLRGAAGCIKIQPCLPSGDEPMPVSETSAIPSTERSIVFVDLETTGGSAGEDRITEIGVVEVDGDGVRHWSTLVDPARPIPEFIQRLTGITDAMVCGAPTFDAVAADLAQRLDGKLFIAHNARFDHGFLKSAFQREGIGFDPDVLCTVRLSRALFPQESRHGLDAVVQRLRLTPSGRHRALADADLIWQFWQRIHALHPRQEIDAAIARLIRGGGADELTDALPAGSGVYIYYGDDDVPLYVGKSARVRQRVRTHLFGDRRSVRDIALAERVRRIEAIEVAGEIGLLLQEARSVAALEPAFNRRRRAAQKGAPPWPYGGPIALIERDIRRFAQSYHVVVDWRYAGTAPDRDGAQALAQRAHADSAALAFDAGVFKIVSQRLARGGLPVERLFDAASVVPPMVQISKPATAVTSPCATIRPETSASPIPGSMAKVPTTGVPVAQAMACATLPQAQPTAPNPPVAQTCDSARRIDAERDAS